jgi:hypothetical protein
MFFWLNLKSSTRVKNTVFLTRVPFSQSKRLNALFPNAHVRCHSAMIKFNLSAWRQKMKTNTVVIGCVCCLLTAGIAGNGTAADPKASASTPQAAASAPQAAAAAPAPAGALTVPAGTKLLVQLSQNVSTSSKSAGQKFQAILQGNLAVDKQVIAADGSKVFGVVQKIQTPEGKSVMALFLNEIMINGQLQPIVTQPLGVQGPDAGKAAASGAVKGAVVGAAFGHHGGSAAAGAMVGAAASSAKAKSSAGVPAGQLLDFYLAEPLVVAGK